MAEDAYAFKFEGKEHRLAKLMLAEARAMQRVTGKTILQIGRALDEGDVDCLAALIWIAQKRDQPTLKFEEVDGDVLSFEWVADEEPEQAGAEGNGQAPEGLLEMEQIALANPATPRDAP